MNECSLPEQNQTKVHSFLHHLAWSVIWRETTVKEHLYLLCLVDAYSFPSPHTSSTKPLFFMSSHLQGLSVAI